MDELTKYTEAYMNAVVMKDSKKEESLKRELEALVLLLFLTTGKKVLSSLLNVLPAEVGELKFEPTDTELQKKTADLQAIFTGFKQRLLEYKKQLHEKEPKLSEEEINQRTLDENQWQKDRIVNSEEEIFRGLTEIIVLERIVRQQGYVIYKRWVAHLDGKTCPTCRAMHNTRIPFSENFEYNGVGIDLNSHYSQFAHAHSNCRCTIEFEIERRNR